MHVHHPERFYDAFKLISSLRVMLTEAAAAAEFERQAASLTSLVSQSCAHRRKFQFAAQKYLEFADGYAARHTGTNQLTDDQMNAFTAFITHTKKYHGIIAQNMAHCWAHYAINTDSVRTAAELVDVCKFLNQQAVILEKEIADCFNPSDPNWLTYHLYDLRAIQISFEQFLHDKAIEMPQAVETIKKRLGEIKKFLDQYAEESKATQAMKFSPIPMNYRNWKLEASDFKAVKEIGQGASANVSYGRMTKTNEEVAIKKLKFRKLEGGRLKAYQRELIILATAIHPCLLRFVGATDSFPYCILTEWMGGGNLFEELHSLAKLSPSELTIVAFDIARGMHFLHARQIVHRDLKSLNVLLSKDGKAKICDFGFSRQLGKAGEKMTQNVGTPHWMAPELLAGSSSYDASVDIYAYGVVLWEILTREIPYGRMEPKDIMVMVLTRDARPDIPEDTPANLKALIKACWATDPKERPTSSEILQAFKEGKILYPDADWNIVKKHVDEATAFDRRDTATLDALVEKAKTQTISISELCTALGSSEIPIEHTDTLWQMLKKADHSDIVNYSRCLLTFLRTNKIVDASKALRYMEPNSISEEIVDLIIKQIPTGNGEADTNLVIAACKNGKAEEATICAISPLQSTIGLEILSRQIISTENRAAILTKCANSIYSNNTGLIMAAMKCMIAIGESKRIGVPRIFEILNMGIDKVPLKSVAMVALASIIEQGTAIPSNIFRRVLEIAPDIPLSACVLSAAASDPELLGMIMETVAANINAIPVLAIAPVFCQAVKVPEYTEKVKDLLKQVDMNIIPNDQKPLIENILK